MVSNNSKLYCREAHKNVSTVTDVFQSDDVGMLPVSHQDFDLFRGVPLNFVYNLRHDNTGMSSFYQTAVYLSTVQTTGFLYSEMADYAKQQNIAFKKR